MDQPRKVAKSARGQLNREIKCPCRCIRGKYILKYIFTGTTVVLLLFVFVYIPGIFFIWGHVHPYSCTVHCCCIIITNDTLARSLEPVVTERKEHIIHTQTQVVASKKPKKIKRTHECEANLTT